MKESFGGVALTNSDITDHNLKIALQTVIEKECGYLFSAYGYRVKSIFCGFSHERQAYRIEIAIFDPSPPNNFLNFQREISGMELTRNTIYRGVHSDVSIINKNEELFLHYFHAIACDIRHEIEKKTKDMPPIMGVYTSGSVTATEASNHIVNYMNATMSINEARYLQGLPEIPEKIVYNGILPGKKSKFEHIDALIASSKTRLSGSYASPRFEFKHF